MLGNKWFCESDDERKSWCFLLVELNGGNAGCEIAGWQIGYGNPKKMVKTVEKSGGGEEETIKTLVEDWQAQEAPQGNALSLN